MMLYDITIIWDPSLEEDFDHYLVQRGPAAVGPWETVGTTKKSAFLDKDLPAGTYYYRIIAVDKLLNQSTPSTPIAKTAPMDITAPPAPTFARAYRSDDLETTTVIWGDVPSEDLKGYVVYRDIGDGAGPWVHVLTSSSKFKDSEIPPFVNANGHTYLTYYIASYDKFFNVSVAIAATPALLKMPTVTGHKAVVDYLAISIYFSRPRPETPTITTFKMLAAPATTGIYYWAGNMVGGIFVASTIPFPGTSMQASGYWASGAFVPFASGSNYLIGVAFDALTGPQAGFVLVSIPTYMTDAIAPSAPNDVYAELDKDTDTVYSTWAHDYPDDLLEFHIWIWIASVWYYHGRSKTNTYALRNASKLGDTIYIGVKAVDRSGNMSGLASSNKVSFTLEVVPISIVQFTGVTSLIKGFYNLNNTVPTDSAIISLNWHHVRSLYPGFKAYVLFETRVGSGTPWIPTFSLSEDAILEITEDNKATVYIFPTSGVKVAWAVGILDCKGIIRFDTVNTKTLVMIFP